MPGPLDRRFVWWLVGVVVGLAVLSAGSLALLDLRIERSGQFAYDFLPWNLLLAWVPFVLALLLGALHRYRGPRPVLWLVGVGWLLFLPNAPYIVTDFIHLGRAGGVPLWFDAALIGSFAGTGLALGLASLLIVHRVVELRAGRVVGWVVAVGSLLLSAVGIYLGRFPRFNSWDVLTDPRSLIEVLAKRLADPLGNPFLLQFGAVMSMLLVGSYLVAWIVGRGIAGSFHRATP